MLWRADFLSHSQLLVLFLLTVYSFSIFGYKEYNQSDFGVDPLVMPMYKVIAGGAPQKERGSGTSLSKAKGSWGEVSLLSANPAPQRARDNQMLQGFRLSSSALLPQTLGLYRQARGFFEGWTNHIKGQIVICHSCTNHVKGQVVMRFIVTRVYGDHVLSTCTEIKRANQKFWQTTYVTPSSLPPGAILALNRKASPSFLRFPI